MGRTKPSPLQIRGVEPRHDGLERVRTVAVARCLPPVLEGRVVTAHHKLSRDGVAEIRILGVPLVVVAPAVRGLPYNQGRPLDGLFVFIHNLTANVSDLADGGARAALDKSQVVVIGQVRGDIAVLVFPGGHVGGSLSGKEWPEGLTARAQSTHLGEGMACGQGAEGSQARLEKVSSILLMHNNLLSHSGLKHFPYKIFYTEVLLYVEINNNTFAIMNFNIYPRPWDIRYFQEIARTLNLSRAAERLGVGQAALSLSLKRLEESLQTKLFLRRNRGLKLTPAGQTLLKASNRLLSDWEAVITETKKSNTEITGLYTVGCHPSVAIYSLKNIIGDLYRSFPRLEIRLVHNLSRIICEEIISGNIDFGIVVNPVKHPDLIIRKLARDEVGFWKTPGGPDDVLIYNPELTQSHVVLKKSRTFERSITSSNLEVIATLADAGVGTGILPGRVAKAIGPNLVRQKNQPQYMDEITFLYRADLPKTRATQSIIQAFKSLSIP